MRKIDSEYENHIDDQIIELCSNVSSFFESLNMTANDITTLSLISGLASIYYLYDESYRLGAILFFISYMFDCLDGFYARKNNMVSKFGDMYDHVKDLIVLVGVDYIIFSRITKHRTEIYILLIILIILFSIHIGCQEIHYSHTNPDESPTLTLSKRFCPATNHNDSKKIMEYTRFVGNGTFMAILTIVLYNLDKFI